MHDNAHSKWNVNIPDGEIYNDVTLPIGSVLYEKKSTMDALGGHGGTFYCGDSGTYNMVLEIESFMTGENIKIGGNKVFPTSMPGVGISISFSTDISNEGHIEQEAPDIYQGARWDKQREYKMDNGFVTIKLIKISSSVDVNGFLTYTVPNLISAANEGGKNALNLIDLNLTAVVNVPSCEFKSETLNVLMKRASPSDFKGIGSITEEKQSAIVLLCEKNANASVSIDAPHVGGADQGIVKINEIEGAASGVGIKLLWENDRTPIQFGVPRKVSMDAGEDALGFIAAYIQTEKSIKAGRADGVATYSLTYN
jgi:type 1 fimbria pilin